MLLEKLRLEVYQANMGLPELGLVSFTWGNVSGYDAQSQLFVIKPSGLSYEQLTPANLVVLDLSGNVVEGELKPSTDAPTHAYLYQHFSGIGGITHTHSSWAVAYAAAGLDVPVVSTTHADTFFGDVPCVPTLTAKELTENYEQNTGKAIVRTFAERGINHLTTSAALMAQHGPFTWGKDAGESVYHAKVLEVTAEITHRAMQLTHADIHLPQHLLDKHYQRKHGKTAYYGQA